MYDDIATLTQLGATSYEDEVLGELTQQVRRFGDRHVDAASIDQSHEIPEGVLRGLAEMGLFSASIPQKYGGAGFGLQGTCALVAELARIDRSVATTVGLHLGLGTRGIIQFGPESVRQAILPKMATGEWIASFAATEPDAGSDLTAVSTRVDQDGATIVLNGAKAYVTNSGFSKVLTLLVSSPGLGGARRGHSLLYIHRDDPGVSFGPEETKLGLRGSSTRAVYFDDTRIPASRIIGEPGRGMEHTHEVLSWGRTAMAAGCIGAATAAFERALQYVHTRKQFGKQLVAMPVVRDQIATMDSTLFAMESLVRNTARGAGDAATLVARSAAGKVFCSEGSWAIADTALQLHGGLGFIEETGMSMLLRDARITRIFEGANDVLCIHAGGMEATQPRERDPISAAFGANPLGEFADDIARRVQSHREILCQEHGVGVLRDHRLLHQLGAAVVVREATDAAVLRAIAVDRPEVRARARHWVELATLRLDDALRPLPAASLVEAVMSGLA